MFCFVAHLLDDLAGCGKCGQKAKQEEDGKTSIEVSLLHVGAEEEEEDGDGMNEYGFGFWGCIYN